jgi:hypothetical protein
MTESEYKRGLKNGVQMYAWMKGGVYYVGTWGTTLKKALSDIDKEYPDE